MRKTIFRIGESALVVLVAFAAAGVGLKLYDNHIMKTVPAPASDAELDTTTMRTFDYYPFTALHTQAYMREKGEVAWTQYYKDFDVVSGEYGFFIDFHLETPPVKQPGEIRLILTGGSGAAGWGGRTNADMFYKKLSVSLTDRLKSDGRACSVNVINLAMGGTHIYQNFIALNKWGHRLDPDGIISFSGHNEIAVPWSMKSDADYGAANMAGLARLSRYSDSPQWLKDMANVFPGIVRRTHFGFLVRSMYLQDMAVDWNIRYITSFLDPDDSFENRNTVNQRYVKVASELTMDNLDTKISTPLYVHSLESIARDFPNIPVWAVFQPLASTPDIYSRIITDVPKIVGKDGYKNITFYNMHKIWQDHEYYSGSLVDSVHLSNEGHTLVANYLGDYLYPYIKTRCDSTTRKGNG